MLLSELHGYKRYADKDIGQIIRSLSSRWSRDGSYSFVVAPKRRTGYVYKLWTDDIGYESYYRLITTKLLGNPFVPKVGKIHRLPIFFKRPESSGDFINILKIEELRLLSYTTKVGNFIGALEQSIKLGSFELAKRFWTPKSISEMGEYMTPDQLLHMRQLIDEVGALLSDAETFRIDVRFDNVMTRGDSQMVLIDPVALSSAEMRRSSAAGKRLTSDLLAFKDEDYNPVLTKSGSRAKVRS